MAGIKITSADQWFSKCVRERSEWKCERCGTYYPPGNTQGLDCSHYYGRADGSVRHFPFNAMSHCRGCHQWLTSRPEEHSKLYRLVFGEECVDKLLVERANIDRGRAIKRNLKGVAKHYRAEYDRMRSLRSDGVTGRLEFNDVEWREL